MIVLHDSLARVRLRTWRKLIVKSGSRRGGTLAVCVLTPSPSSPPSQLFYTCAHAFTGADVAEPKRRAAYEERATSLQLDVQHAAQQVQSAAQQLKHLEEGVATAAWMRESSATSWFESRC